MASLRSCASMRDARLAMRSPTCIAVCAKATSLRCPAERSFQSQALHLPRQRRQQAAPAPASSSADAGSAPGGSADTWELRLGAISGKLTQLFPVWVILAAVVALTYPPAFLWLSTKDLTGCLAATMLMMGLTMRVQQFTEVFQRMPQLLLLGLVLQFTVMPGLGFVFSRYAGLSVPLSMGMILLSSCPGGTASNIVAYIARGEMGLSIMMTTASTLAAIVATPLLTKFLAGQLVPVNAQALFMSTVQVVLAPVLVGAFVNQRFPVTVARFSAFSPFIATALIALIVGSTLAHSADAVLGAGLPLLGAVVGLHASGFLLGYTISRVLGLSEKICRTNSIEVGMQNSTLGAVLATLHFSDPLVAAPCALSSCVHAMIGSLLAAYWRSQPMDETDDPLAPPALASASQ